MAAFSINLEYIYEICAFFSLLGSLSIIISYLLIKELQTFYFRLVFFLAISDLLYSSGTLHSGFLITLLKTPQHNPYLCTAQGFLLNYSLQVSISITLLISYSLYKIVLKKSFEFQSRISILIFLSFFIPVFFSGPPIFFDYYKFNRGWCTVIIDDIKGYLLMFLEFHGYFLIAFVINLSVYWRIRKELRESSGNIHDLQLFRNVYDRLKWYPIFMAICFGPVIFVRQVIYIFGVSEEDGMVFVQIAGITDASNGLFNALLYGFNYRMRRKCKEIFCLRNQLEVNLLSD